jgi:superkiller protein 3
MLSSSIIAHRILADVYVRDFDYQNAIKAAERGLELVSRSEIDNGKKLRQ